MARHRIKLPPLGESVERVLIVEWHVAIGDAVTQNSVLATVETDKVDTDVPSPMAGTVVEILAGAGAELAVGEPLCVIES